MPATGRKLIRIKVGDPIRAEFLNESVDNINELVDLLVDRPKQLDPADDPDLQNAKNEDDTFLGEGDSPDVFVEQNRTIDEVIVFDQNDENFATIDRIVTIELLNGLGETLKMRINNNGN